MLIEALTVATTKRQEKQAIDYHENVLLFHQKNKSKNTIDNGRAPANNTQDEYSLRVQAMPQNAHGSKDKRIIMFSAQQMKNKIIMSPSNNGYANPNEEIKELQNFNHSYDDSTNSKNLQRVQQQQSRSSVVSQTTDSKHSGTNSRLVANNEMVSNNEVMINQKLRNPNLQKVHFPKIQTPKQLHKSNGRKDEHQP